LKKLQALLSKGGRRISIGEMGLALTMNPFKCFLRFQWRVSSIFSEEISLNFLPVLSRSANPGKLLEIP
jgi:hypothetical protein